MNDRSFFIVSALNPALERESSLFVADPFFKYLIDTNSALAPKAQLKVGSFIRKCPEDLREANRVVWSKYNTYIPILSNLLNEIHNTKFGKDFWRRAFSMALVRHLTFMYDFFMICETHFDPTQHGTYQLASDCFYIPVDYNEHRWFLQHSHFGQEQLFSMYLNLFHPGYGSSYNSTYESSYELNRIITRTGDYNPSVGVMGALFDESSLHNLIIRSKGAIAPIGFDFNLPARPLISYTKRTKLRYFIDDFDRFDKFFFSSLPFMLPREFVENFELILCAASNKFDLYANLKYVVSETFIGETYESMALAILKERGVTIVYNEHNYCEHPCYSSILEQQTSFADIFASHGNYYAPINNKVSTGSLFPFYEKRLAQDKKFDILYVCGLAEAKYAYFSHTFMLTAEHALFHYDFKLRFFKAMPEEVVKKILYRSYPSNPQWALVYDDNLIMSEFLSSLIIDDHSTNGRARIQESRLVIIDYWGTTHFESMIMNVPTIIFYRKNSYFLNNHSRDFLDELHKVGICQDDPENAAKFIEQISQNPEKWWFQPEVQAAKDHFLEKNLGKPEYLVNFLLDLASGATDIKFDYLQTPGGQMKIPLSSFKYNDQSRVYSNYQGAPAEFAYSDGFEVEERIYRILRETKDLGIFSRELCSRITDWPSEYHFSPMRHNLLRHINFKPTDRVLELGCGCGAITRQIGESGANTSSIEGSMLRAQCAAERCRDLPNVKVYCANFQDISLAPEYDYVTLIGVLEYSSMFFVGGEPFKQCLEIAKSALKANGKLIVAIENRLGLKYFLGFSEDHTSNVYDGLQDFYDKDTARTFGKKELTDLLHDNGFLSVDFSCPFPDYKMPKAVIFELGIRTSHFSVSDIISQIKSRDYSYPEKKLPTESFIWSQLENNGLLADLSNSFLVQASLYKRIENKSELARYYTVDRKREFNTETIFELDGTHIMVTKNKLEAGLPSVQNPLSQVLHEGNYVEGQCLDYFMDKAIVRNRFDEFVAYFKLWLNFIFDNGLELLNSDNIFMSIIKSNFIDCKPRNIIINNGELVLIDAEWSYNKPCTVYSLVIRYLMDIDHEFINLNISCTENTIANLFKYFNVYYDGEIHNEYLSVEDEISNTVFDSCHAGITGGYINPESVT